MIEDLNSIVRNSTILIQSGLNKIESAVSDYNKYLSKIKRKTAIVLHHTLTKDSLTVSWGPIRKHHIHTLGWADIGYHAGIEEVRDPGVYEILIGRNIFDNGAHCPQGNMNRNGFGFVFTGNFDLGPPPEKMLEKAAEYLASICVLFDISVDMIHGHHYYNQHKTCPGKQFNVTEFRQIVKSYI